MESNNVQICKSLARTSYSFGLDQMFKDKVNFSDYISNKFKESKSSHLAEDGNNHIYLNNTINQQDGFPVRPPSANNDSDVSASNPLMNLHRTMRPRNKSLAFRRKKTLSSTNLKSPDLISDEPKSKQPQNPMEKATKEQILNYLALTYDIESRITENPTSFHLDTFGKLNHALPALRNEFYEETRFMEAYMNSTISQLLVAKDLVLRKPKVDAEVTADTEPRTEIEIQTEEDEKDKKGKAKGKKK